MQVGIRFRAFWGLASAILLLLTFGCHQGKNPGLAEDFMPAQVRIEGLDSPLALDTPTPRITWEIATSSNGQRVTAYRILALDSSSAVALDTGRVDQPDTLDALWTGRTLRSMDFIRIMIMAWDKDGKPSHWSEPVFFGIGLLTPADWPGQWIAATLTQPDPLSPAPAPLMRRSFTVAKPVVRARCFIAGIGYHELSLNGRKVGNHVLDPGFTPFDRRVLYVAHDVTSYLKDGSNVLGVVLGNGFLNPSWTDAWGFESAPWRSTPRLQLRLEIEHSDGSRTTVVSDSLWKTAPGPIIRDALRNGENYDARREVPGWDTVDVTDTSWAAALPSTPPRGLLTAQAMAPIRVTGTVPVVRITEPRPGIFVADFGQNLAGWVRCSVIGEAGRTVTFRYGERLASDGALDTSQIDMNVYTGNFQTDHYTFKGGGTETWEPRFVYHGFQYVQVMGLAGPLTPDMISARRVHTDFPRIGNFSSSDPTLNALYSAAVESYLNNFQSIPTDCPHREKNGWTGDAHLAADFGLLTFGGGPNYAKWLRDIRDEQTPTGALPGIVPTSGWGYTWGNGPAWDSALALIPYDLYLYTGDPAPLIQTFAALSHYVDYVGTVPYMDASPPGWLGDWGELDQVTPLAVSTAAFHIRCLRILALTCRLMGNEALGAQRDTQADAVVTTFNAHYVLSATGTVAGNTQTALSASLEAGLLAPDVAQRAFGNLVSNLSAQNNHVNAGVLGAKTLLRALSAGERTDLAFLAVTQRDFPGWGNWIARGATTLWEFWNGEGSLDHAFTADIGAWMMEDVGGIRPDLNQPGWRNIIFAPFPVQGMAWAQCELQSPRGRISSSWRHGQGVFTWDVQVPVGCTGTLMIPVQPGQVVHVPPGAVAQGMRGSRSIFYVGSGHFEIKVDDTATLSQPPFESLQGTVGRLRATRSRNRRS